MKTKISDTDIWDLLSTAFGSLRHLRSVLSFHGNAARERTRDAWNKEIQELLEGTHALYYTHAMYIQPHKKQKEQDEDKA